MRTSARAALAATAIALLTLGGGAAASAAPAIPLNNGQEVTGAEGGAHGFFTYTIEGTQFCYTLSVKRLTAPATAAHVHVAPQGVAGPVVIGLTIPNQESSETSACTTVDQALLTAIAENPRAYYVNVHTSTYPGGEVRGQLK
ncbi:CHRD domain-containing protein [Microbacterium sp. NPDC056569]|uniref:CHRD domain-containing protein n=1 Tax=Microbacterium sp. NPDC056569 TaxID=3345867 RepID=UPI00366CF635